MTVIDGPSCDFDVSLTLSCIDNFFPVAIIGVIYWIFNSVIFFLIFLFSFSW